MRTIEIPKQSCFLVIHPNMQAEINVPSELENDEVPYHSKYTVALAHLIYEGNPILDKLVKDKWNELVDGFKTYRNLE